MSPQPLKPLTVAELCDLRTLEIKVERLASAFREGLPALIEIKERRLYRKAHSTWQEYCKERWGWTARYVDLQIEAGVALQQLPDKMRTKVPNLEAAKELAKVPEEKREKVVTEAVKAGGATAKNIATAAKSSAPTAPPIPLDKTGTKIPKPALPFWDRRDEVQPWLSQISDIKCAIEKALKAGDSLFAWTGQSAVSHLESAYFAISNSKLYAVCTQCQGWWDKMTGGGCATCHNTGLISKHQYDVCSRSEIKVIRERANRV